MPRTSNQRVQAARSAVSPLAGRAGATILTPGAVAFVNALVRRFGSRVQRLLADRMERQRRFDAGELPGFFADTRAIRDSEWRVAPIPADQQDRRVEISGPPDRKTVITALGSGARAYLADFEDALSPTWSNIIEGQANLFEAVRGTLVGELSAGDVPQQGTVAVLAMTPRGWDRVESHWIVEGATAPAALVDFGLYLFHNQAELAARGTGPYFTLPKLESHFEARLWADVFAFAEASLHLQQGTIKVTVAVDALQAAFELEEILWELRHYATALATSRWTYLAGFLKALGMHPEAVLPDRRSLETAAPFLKACANLVVRTAHRRGVLALAAATARFPAKGNGANDDVVQVAEAEAERHASDGFDGSQVIDPALVPLTMSVYDRLMPQPNNLLVERSDAVITEVELLRVPEGTVAPASAQANVSLAVEILAAWLGGQGSVVVDGHCEDIAMADFYHRQLASWIRHRRAFPDGRVITLQWLKDRLQAEHARLSASPMGSGLRARPLRRAAELLWEKIVSKDTRQSLAQAADQLLVARD